MGKGLGKECVLDYKSKEVGGGCEDFLISVLRCYGVSEVVVDILCYNLGLYMKDLLYSSRKKLLSVNGLGPYSVDMVISASKVFLLEFNSRERLVSIFQKLGDFLRNWKGGSIFEGISFLGSIAFELLSVIDVLEKNKGEMIKLRQLNERKGNL